MSTATANPLLVAAVLDPRVQTAAQGAAQDAALKQFDYHEDDVSDAHKALQLQVSTEEFMHIKQWAQKMRVGMVIISILMVVIGLSNVIAGASTETSLLACYLIFFALLLCCYEMAIKRVAIQIAINFGFIYSPKGRLIFLVFLALLCFQLSLFGKILFAMLLVMGLLYAYICYKHPQFPVYMRKLHYFGKDATQNQHVALSQSEA